MHIYVYHSYYYNFINKFIGYSPELQTTTHPIAGYGFQILSATVIAKYVSATESSNNSLYLGYVSNSTSAYWGVAGRFMSGKTSDTTFTLKDNVSTSPALLASFDDKPLVLYSNGNFNGDFTADVYITYQVIQL